MPEPIGFRVPAPQTPESWWLHWYTVWRCIGITYAFDVWWGTTTDPTYQDSAWDEFLGG